MNKTLLVDANYLLKQAFHGNKETYTSYGHIGGIMTFYMIVRRYIKQFGCNKVILFWDSPTSGKLRYDIYPDYKSNRKKNWNGDTEFILSDKDIKKLEDSEESLMLQRIRVKQYAEELFIRQVEDDFCEADDCIAYYTNNLMKEDEECIIYTADKDLLQLLDDRVDVFLGNKQQLVSKNNFSLLYYNYKLSNLGLIKAIEGCDSDIIFGVEKMGEKSLLKYFPELRTQEVSFDFIYHKAIEINKGRKTPLVSLENLINGRTKGHVMNETIDAEHPGRRNRNLFDDITNGKQLFELNWKLVNLKEPLLRDVCIEEIENQTQLPLNDENRGGKNLLRLMYEDGLINSIPNGPDGYKDFLLEFLPVVNREKAIYKNYLNN